MVPRSWDGSLECEKFQVRVRVRARGDDHMSTQANLRASGKTLMCSPMSMSAHETGSQRLSSGPRSAVAGEGRARPPLRAVKEGPHHLRTQKASIRGDYSFVRGHVQGFSPELLAAPGTCYAGPTGQCASYSAPLPCSTRSPTSILGPSPSTHTSTRTGTNPSPGLCLVAG